MWPNVGGGNGMMQITGQQQRPQMPRFGGMGGGYGGMGGQGMMQQMRMGQMGGGGAYRPSTQHGQGNFFTPWSQPGSYVYQTSGMNPGGFGQGMGGGQDMSEIAFNAYGQSYPAMYAPRSMPGGGWASYGGLTPIQHMQQQADAARSWGSASGGGNVYAALGIQPPQMQQQQSPFQSLLAMLMGMRGQQAPSKGPGSGGPVPQMQQPKKQTGYIDPVTGEVGR